MGTIRKGNNEFNWSTQKWETVDLGYNITEIKGWNLNDVKITKSGQFCHECSNKAKSGNKNIICNSK